MKCILIILLAIMINGCTEKKSIPPEPPKKHIQTQETRTVLQMQKKLKKLRKPLSGVYLSRQKRNTYTKIDTLLNDTRKYRDKLDYFYKTHPLAVKKPKIRKAAKVKTIVDELASSKLSNGGNNVSQLKYY